jgi:hypothetical protein
MGKDFLTTLFKPKVSSCCDLHFLSWNFDQRHTQALTKLGFMLTNTQEENVLVMKEIEFSA